jgi:hypothetical protein
MAEYTTHLVNGIEVALTAPEIAALQARDAAWLAAQPAALNAIARANRAAAFSNELDPFAMKMLRGETDAHGGAITTATLTALAADIRARFPYT